MVMAPFKERRSADSGTNSGQLFFEGIQRNETLRQRWDETTNTFRAGSWNTLPPSRVVDKSEAVTLHTFPSSTWSDKLVIRQEAKEFFDGSTQTRERINYGIHLHAILSRIRFAKDLPVVLDQLIGEGLIVEQDRPLLQQQIEELLQLPEVSAWFSTEWDVRTEVPILLPGGAENRIDRLMINGKRAVIVDFKTGEPSTADQRQVLEYIDVLRQMNFVQVEGYLLYVRTGSCVVVSQKKVKSPKKKDDNQLALGL
jgi:ATP-dependent exoDNAse (exonuclease V) beta subunit